MNMHDYVRICRRRWAAILFTVLIAVMAAGVIYPLQPVTYAATTKIYVSAASGSNLQELQQGSDFAEQRATTYADLVTTPAVLGPVIEDLGLPMVSSELAENIDAEALGGTTLLEITVIAGEPQEAADIANSTVTNLQTLVDDIESPGAGPATGPGALVELAVVQAAEVPDRPQSPRLEMTLGIGLALGLLFGLGLAFLRESLDTSVRAPRDLEDLTGAPLLGITRRVRAVRGNQDRPAPRSAESAASFREMRMRLMFGEPHGSPSSYVVTSSLEREERASVAVNLARSMVEGGRRTLLIGADSARSAGVPRSDLRPPGTGERRDSAPIGLSEVLSGEATLEDVVISCAEPGLDVMPAGRGVGQHLESSQLDAMAAMLGRCAETYDVTIIEAPALLSASDAALLGQIATGVIVVARYGEVTGAQLSVGVDLLARARARLAGVVFTGVPLRGPDSLRDRRSRRRRLERGQEANGGMQHLEQDIQALESGPSSARRHPLPEATPALTDSGPRTVHTVTITQHGE